MTDEQIQQWAKEVGVSLVDGRYYCFGVSHLKAFAKLVHDDALVQGEPSDYAALLYNDGDGGLDFIHGDLPSGEVKVYTAPPAQTPPPLLTVDDVLKIALDCNIRVRTGSGAVKFARAIEAAVRKQFGVTE